MFSFGDDVSYREHAPSPALRSRIDCYWTRFASGPASSTRVLPDGCIDILFDVDRGAASIVGVMTRALVSSNAQSTALLGVRFRPGEAPAWLGFAARESRDAFVDLRDAWGSAGTDLASRIAEAPTVEARLRLLDHVLLDRSTAPRSDLRVRRAIETIGGSRGAVDVESVARSVGLGARQLERAFDHWVGVGPKAFARIARLQAFLRQSELAVSWAELALDLGYADQAHLIRDVGKLAGVTPVELRKERRAGVRDVGNVQSRPSLRR